MAPSFEDSSEPSLGQRVHVACDLCGTDDPEFLFKKKPFRHVRCRRCGLVYATPRLRAFIKRQKEFSEQLHTIPGPRETRCKIIQRALQRTTEGGGSEVSSLPHYRPHLGYWLRPLWIPSSRLRTRPAPGQDLPILRFKQFHNSNVLEGFMRELFQKYCHLASKNSTN